MYRVLVCCGGGMSSSLLMAKTREAIESHGLADELSVDFYPLQLALARMGECDCVLVAPQVGYAIDRIREAAGDVPCAVIPPEPYGMMDGERILEIARALLRA